MRGALPVLLVRGGPAGRRSVCHAQAAGVGARWRSVCRRRPRYRDVLPVSLHVRASAMVRLLETGQLADHMAAAEWLKKQSFVQPQRVATMGNSFGGIITVLAAERFALLRRCRCRRRCANLVSTSACPNGGGRSPVAGASVLLSGRERLHGLAQPRARE